MTDIPFVIFATYPRLLMVDVRRPIYHCINFYTISEILDVKLVQTGIPFILVLQCKLQS